MSIESRLSGHWTDDEFIGHLYGLGPGDGHLERCGECAARWAVLEKRRQGIVAAAAAEQEEAGYGFLAEQRRAIYNKVSAPGSQAVGSLRCWVSAAATVLVLGGSVFFYEQRQAQVGESHVTDAQLAQDVSLMSLDSEPLATAPLQALFEE
jgi:hypothetical protein